MTKSELIARDKRYIEVISGAVYRENGECVNVQRTGLIDRNPLWHWNYNDPYELFTPDFSWELFKEGLVAVRCDNTAEWERFKTGLLTHGMNRWANGLDITTRTFITPVEQIEMYVVYNNKPNYAVAAQYADWEKRKRRIIIPFTSIPPELLQPAFVPQKPETFTLDEWRALTDEQRIACNELIQDKIEYDKNGFATNLQHYYVDGGYYSEAYTYTDINTCQYRIEPAPVYEPYDKPEPWMIGRIVRSRLSGYESIITGRNEGSVIVNGMVYTVAEMFEDADFLDVATGETKPFGKVKGE